MTDDINDVPPPALDRGDQELQLHAARYADQWALECPWYATRSEVDPHLLIVGASFGTDERTGIRNNADGTIGRARNLNALDGSHVVIRDGVQLTASQDLRGRTYCVRYVRIVEGRILRVWLSQYEGACVERPWRDIRKRQIRLSESAKSGYVVVL